MNYDIIYRVATDLSGLQQGVKDTAVHTEAIDKKMTELQGSVSEVGKTLRDAFENPIGTLKNLGSTLISEGVGGLEAFAFSAAGVATGLGVITAAGGYAVEKFLELGEELLHASYKTSDTVENLGRLKITMDVIGGSLDQATNSMFRLQMRLGEGGAMAEKSTAGLAKLGIKADELIKLPASEWIYKISEGFRNNTDSTNRAAIAFELFSRQGREILPTLMHDLTGLRDKYGDIADITTEDAENAETLSIAWRGLKESVSWTITDIGAGVVGFFKSASEYAMDLELVFEKLTGGGIAMDKLFSNLPNPALKKADAGLTEDQVKWTKALMISEEDLKAVNKDVDAQLKVQIEDQKKADEALKQYKKTLDSVTDVTQGYAQVLNEVDGETVNAIRYYLEHGKSVKDLSVIYQLHESQIKAVQDQMKFETSVTDATAKKFGFLKDHIVGVIGVQYDMARALGFVTKDGLIPARDTLEQVGHALMGLEAPGQRMRGTLERIGSDMGKFFRTELPGTIQKAIEGGGQAWEAVGNMIGQKVGSKVSDAIADKMSKSNNPLFAKMGDKDSLLGGIMSGGLTAAIGAGMTLLTKGLSALVHIGGPSKEEKEGRAAVDQMEKQLHGMLTTQQKLEAGGSSWKMTVIGVRDAYLRVGKTQDEALAAVNNFWSAEKRGAAATAEAFAPIQAAIQLAKDSQDALNAALSRYQFTTEQLGPALAGQKLDEQAQQLYKDWQVLNAAGIDHTAILAQMSGNLNDYFNQAIKAGVEIPEAMKPMLQQFADAGKLLDANGDSITDLDKAGAKFSLTMSEGFKSLIDTVKDLANAIRASLGLALQDLPRTVDVNINERHNVSYFSDNGENAFRGGIVGPFGLSYFGRGGVARGGDIVPAMLSPGEMVLTPQHQANLASALDGGKSGMGWNTSGMERRLDAMLASQQRATEQLPFLIREAMLRTA